MKAIIKSTRKTIDVVWYDALPREDGKGYFLLYKDTQSEDVYSDNELEFIEYYGG